MTVAYTLPAIQARMGSTSYYQVAITARDLASVAVPVGELAEWKQWSISERFQRELAMRRINEEIIPYLVRSADRFFGSLIILVYEADVFKFEPLQSLNITIPAAHRSLVGRMGFLTISGGQLVALDGQHRLVALREVVAGRNEVDGEFSSAVADDELCVVFVLHESLQKTRRIFNKVNQHARPTTRTDNIITSEDDGYAIVARWLVESDPPLGLSGPKPPLGLLHPRTGEPLVEWKSTSLGTNQEALTTLDAVFQSVEAILSANGLTNFGERDRVTRPPEAQLEKAYTWAAEWWAAALAGIEAYAHAVEKPYLIPDLRKSRASEGLLFRPIAQVALFKGLADAVVAGKKLESAIEYVNRIDWRPDSVLWRDILVRANGSLITRPEAKNLAARLIAHLLSGDLVDKRVADRLRLDMAVAKGWDPKSAEPVPALPEPICQ
jgi:DNA sulfur modification protein DndB